MLNIILTALFVLGAYAGLSDLTPNGMYLQLALVAVASFGLGALVVRQIYSNQ